MEPCCKAAQLGSSVLFEHSPLRVEVYRPVCFNSHDILYPQEFVHEIFVSDLVFISQLAVKYSLILE